MPTRKTTMKNGEIGKDRGARIIAYIGAQSGCSQGAIGRAFGIKGGAILGIINSLTFQYPGLYEDDSGRLFYDSSVKGGWFLGYAWNRVERFIRHDCALALPKDYVSGFGPVKKIKKPKEKGEGVWYDCQ